MTREEPFFKKCCFFIPLSFCLQTWAIIKILAAVGTLIISVNIMFFILIFGGLTEKYAPMLILLLLMVIVLVLDVAFDVVLIVAVCKKSTKLMGIFFCYDIYVIIAESAVFIGLMISLYAKSITEATAGMIIFGILYITLDICTILALKSEMIKLRNKEQYDFVRISKYPSEIEDIGMKDTNEENIHIECDT